MKIYYKILILLISIVGAGELAAQPQATLSIDTNAILIGDQVNLTLAYNGPAGYQVQWPVIGDTIISEIEILGKSAIDTVYSEDQNNILLRQTIQITSFDSGYFAIPPFRFNWIKPGDSTTHFTETDAQLLQVSNPPVDLQADIKDIKDPLRAPFTFREALPWIIGFVAFAAIGFFVFYYLKKRKKAEPIFKVASKPKLPPHRIALDALESLRYKKLWQNGHIKEYHTELTDIIREYIHGRFQVHAMEFTSDEIMEAINATSTNEQAKSKLRATLMLADLVKFAKEQPLPLEHDASLNNAIDFVKETMYTGPQNGSEVTLANSMQTTLEDTKENNTENSPVENDIPGLKQDKEGKDVQ
ncbi:MAG: hypothetical protein JW731_06020 [Bacteroidales bacterium]|nr:hypothetical protein [Bacteroidales bacterium]